jgi:trans-aconitate 2-methyltransferase
MPARPTRPRYRDPIGTPWDASTYDRSSQPQQEWAADVLQRLAGLAPDARVLDVGCGTGRVTERLCELVPEGRVLAIDASAAMVELARARLGGRAEIWCQDVLELDLEQPVDAAFSTAALHWVRDHERLWRRLASALALDGRLEVQCGGEGNIARVRRAIEGACEEYAPELRDFSPWEFASAETTAERLRRAGFTSIHCWLEERPTTPEDLEEFVTTSILAAHLERLPESRRVIFAEAVVARVEPPLDYVRLNVSARRSGPPVP